MRYAFISILLICFASTGLFAQEELYYVSPDTSVQQFNDAAFQNAPVLPKKKLDLGVSMGSSFGSFYGNSVFSNYVAPEIRYNFNPKFSLTAGTMLTYSMYNGFSLPEENTSDNFWQKKASYYVYARGEYEVSNRLLIRAGGIAEVGSSDGSGFRSGSFGVSYKIGEDSYIHADFQFSTGFPDAGLYYSNGGIFNDPHRFGNGYQNTSWGMYR